MKFDLTLLKLLKVLHDTGSSTAMKVLTNDGTNHSIFKVLANFDECNFNVRGVWCNNKYGNISTCVKSIIYRDLELNTIWELEKIHETILRDFGELANYKCWNQEKNMSDLKIFKNIESCQRKVDEFEFTTNCKTKPYNDNVLIQMVAWQFLSEIYSYLKNNLTMQKYVNDNFKNLCNGYGYLPEEISPEMNVLLKSTTVVRYVKKENYYEDTNIPIEAFYSKQPAFASENISELVDLTRSIILNYFADHLLDIRGEQNCSLHKFLSASLLLVKSKKGKNIFPMVPNSQYYGYSTQRMSVYELLIRKEHDLKSVAFGSTLLEYQTQVFKYPKSIFLFNKLILQIYTKIINYLDERIPFLKSGKKASIDKIELVFDKPVSPYELLLSLYNISTTFIDSILEDLQKEEVKEGKKNDEARF